MKTDPGRVMMRWTFSANKHICSRETSEMCPHSLVLKFFKLSGIGGKSTHIFVPEAMKWTWNPGPTSMWVFVKCPCGVMTKLGSNVDPRIQLHALNGQVFRRTWPSRQPGSGSSVYTPTMTRLVSRTSYSEVEVAICGIKMLDMHVCRAIIKVSER